MQKDYLKLPIAVIGAKSMVGSRFCDLVRNELRLIEADLSQVDITDKESVDNFFKKNNFASVILFSAFTDVDGAEGQRGDKNGQCWQINVEGVRNIVNTCQKYKRKLIFISTDFVFDGINGPYDEDNQTGGDLNLISWYGITKIEAEKIITGNLNDAVILRISYPYRGKFDGKDDILKRILKLAKENKLYPMFADQKTTTTFIDDLPQAFKLIISKNQKGIFHIASPSVSNWYEIAKKLLEVFKLDPGIVKKGSLKDFLKEKHRTPRPVNGGLKVTKISKLGFIPTTWDNGIKIISSQIQGKLI